jgi:riboflavin kinase
LQVIKFIGAVYTGQGSGKIFVATPWVMKQLKRITGFTPYIGTLNLRLTPEGIEQRACLTSSNGVCVEPKAEGYFPGYLYRAKISDIDCYIVLPSVPDYPSDLLEIIAAENLRKRLSIKDGESIAVSVTL